MGCKESFITMKVIWHGYLVLSLDICAHETPTETVLILHVMLINVHETPMKSPLGMALPSNNLDLFYEEIRMVINFYNYLIRFNDIIRMSSGGY